MPDNEISLEDELKAFNFIPTFFGICPYVIIQGSLKLQLSPRRVVYSSFLTLLLIAYLLKIILNFYNPQETTLGRKITNNLLLVQTITICFTSILTLITAIVSINRKNTALEALKSSGITKITPKRKFRQLFWTFNGMLIVYDCICYGINNILLHFWGMHISCLITAASVYQFEGILSVMENEFKIIYSWIKESDPPKLQKAVRSFERVTNAAEHCNEIYGLQLLAIVGSNFYILTSSVYMVVIEKTLTYQIEKILWCVASISIMLRIVSAIDHLIVQRSEFNNTLNDLLFKGYLFSSAAEREKVQLHILMKKDLEFTAKGFFTLDYSLINSVIGAVTTYLVILIQFSE